MLNRRLFLILTEIDGTLSIHQPTLLHEVVPAEHPVPTPDDAHLPGKDELQSALVERSLLPFLEEARKERLRETTVVERHVETSLNTILDRENLSLADLVTQRESGSQEQGLEGRIKQAENRIEELLRRLENRRQELARQRECSITDIRHLGRAWVLPHPDRHGRALAPMRRDDEVERIAVQVATKALEAEGFVEHVADAVDGVLEERRNGEDDHAGGRIAEGLNEREAEAGGFSEEGEEANGFGVHDAGGRVSTSSGTRKNTTHQRHDSVVS